MQVFRRLFQKNNIDFKKKAWAVMNPSTQRIFPKKATGYNSTSSPVMSSGEAEPAVSEWQSRNLPRAS